MNQLLIKIKSVLDVCHPDNKKTIELDYYELSKIYSALKAQELYSASMEKCLMDGFDKMDNIIPIDLPSSDEYKNQTEESNKKIKSEPNYMNELLKKYGRNK